MNPIFLYNSSEGYICTDASESSVQNFFLSVESKLAELKNNSLPKYIHLSKGTNSKLYFDTLRARNEFEICPYRYHIMQRFIRPGCNTAWKVSVDWQEGGCKYFTLTNSLPFEINKFSVFNRRKKTMKSVELFDKNFEDRFVVRFNNAKSYHIVESLQPISHLSLIVKQLIPTLNVLVFKHKVLKEIVLDFVKEGKNNWFFLGIKGYIFSGDKKIIVNTNKKFINLQKKINKYPEISVSQVKTPSSSEELLPNPEARLEKRKMTRISRKIIRRASTLSSFPQKMNFTLPTPEEEYTLYLSQKKSDHLGRIPFNMIGIVPQKLGTHITSFIETKRALLNNKGLKEKNIGLHIANSLSMVSSFKYLNEITLQLDEKLNSAFNLKRKMEWVNKFKCINEILGKSIESVFEKFMVRMKTNEVLSEFFENMPQNIIDSKISAYVKMLKGNLMTEKVITSHCNVSIQDIHYNEFVRVLQEVLTEENVFDSDLILKHFENYRKDLVHEGNTIMHTSIVSQKPEDDSFM